MTDPPKRYEWSVIFRWGFLSLVLYKKMSEKISLQLHVGVFHELAVMQHAKRQVQNPLKAELRVNWVVGLWPECSKVHHLKPFLWLCFPSPHILTWLFLLVCENSQFEFCRSCTLKWCASKWHLKIWQHFHQFHLGTLICILTEVSWIHVWQHYGVCGLEVSSSLGLHFWYLNLQLVR